MYPSGMYLEVIAAFQENTGEQNYIVKDTEETVRYFCVLQTKEKIPYELHIVEIEELW